MVTGENNAQNDDFKLNFRKMVREGKKREKNAEEKKFNLLIGEKKDYEKLFLKGILRYP